MKTVNRSANQGPFPLLLLAWGWTCLAQEVDPLELRRLGSWAWPDGNTPVAASLAGDHLVIADSAGGIRVVDVASAHAPQFGPRWQSGHAPPLFLTAGGNRAYVGSPTNGVDILEVGGSFNLLKVGHHAPETPVQAIEGTTNRLYVAAGSGEANGIDTFVECVDVSVPGQPTRLGVIPLPFEPSVGSLQLAGGRLFVTAGGFYGFDVDDPAVPWREVLAVFPQTSGAGSVRVRTDGQRAFQLVHARFSGAIVIYLVPGGAAMPSLEGSWSTAGNAADFWVSGSLIAVADQPFSWGRLPPPVLDILHLIPYASPRLATRSVLDADDGTPVFVFMREGVVCLGTTNRLLTFEVVHLPAFIGAPVRTDEGWLLRWNGAAAGMQLEWTASMSALDWRVVPGSTATTAVTVPFDDQAARFFRLVRP